MTTSTTTSAARALAETERAQSEASDPASSVWVAANAGAGKTHVLKMRVLRLLLAGTAPERILCLTYTKAAAAEMSERVFGELATWATTDDATLKEQLEKLTGQKIEPAQMAAARKLFARAIETPGGLKVQTIHAFCERLLQRFPLEAGVPPGFSILDDAAGAEIFNETLTDVLGDAANAPESPLGRALRTVVVHVQGDAFDAVMREALGKRAWLKSIADLPGDDGDPSALLRTLYAKSLDLDPATTVDAVAATAANVLDAATLERASEVLATSKGKRDLELSQTLARAAKAKTDADRLAFVRPALLTKQLAPRSDAAFISKAIRTSDPDITDRLCSARDRLADLIVEIDTVRMVDATAALALIAGAVMQGYSVAKTRRAALDFDDLIQRTAGLLSISHATDWVLYKLDGGLDHLLVDEAQDTSPQQWAIVEALVQEFYAGKSARDERATRVEAASPTAAQLPQGPRTVFAVGDEKQSIYSFQGAAPEKFAEVGAQLKGLAEAAGLGWREVPLTLSFRTVPSVLEAVDHVFADPERTPGLYARGAAMRHQAKRAGASGLVEIWATELPDDAPVSDAFQPGAERRTASPAERLAARIADLIGHWISSGERLPSEDRPIQAGDIMILVAKRRPFADVMVAALKLRKIAVAGADRMQLADQLAVKDLLALGQVLTLPEDDLSLAAVLKSPLFDLTDDDLIRVAPKRAGSLYSAIMKHAQTDPKISAVAETLKRWRAVADRRPPFEFYARVLDEDGMRQRLIRRLGPEAIDAIDEFLGAALAFDDGEPASLQGFLTQMSERTHEVKRDMEPGRNQVRVLTVHGSKGLEAPIVFLPDTCAVKGGAGKSALLPLTSDWTRKFWPIGQAPKLVWPIKGSGRIAAIGEAKGAIASSVEQERNRLLYVALTRARDRLYIAGFEGGKPRDPRGWYDSVVNGLEGRLRTVTDASGRDVRQLASEQTASIEQRKSAAGVAEEAVALPAWATSRAGREARPTIPLAPSRIMPLDIDDEGEPVAPATLSGIASTQAPSAASARSAKVPAKGAASSAGEGAASSFDARPDAHLYVREPSSPPPRALVQDYRFLRGRLTHALLEHLPDLPSKDWLAAADRFLAVRGRELSPKIRISIATETLGLLSHPEFAAVFGPGSRAEVPLVAEVPNPSGRGPALRIVGSIDRLVRTARGVMIIDFKTNRPPPHRVADVPAAYLLQLAAYRLALQQIFAVDEVQAALVWTDGTRLMPIPREALDAYQPRLWDARERAPGPRSA